jgi:hypothetical protein
VKNLKQIGMAYGLWASAHAGAPPALVPTSQGGWQDLYVAGLLGPASGDCAQAVFTNYEIMQSQLGQSPSLVVCPADERVANSNFYDPHWTVSGEVGTFGNTNVSYWVGVGAAQNYPRSFLGGDRNLGGGATATGNGTQDPNYGFSPAVGSTGGNDVTLSTNGQMISASGVTGTDGGGYIGWSAKMHSAGDTNGAGNVLLGDGSVQQVCSADLKLNWFKTATDNGNFCGSPPLPNAVRLVFP